MIINLETIYTPYTLDLYSTFNFDNIEDLIINDFNEIDQETGEQRKEPLNLTYDDIEWDYNTKGYLKALANNLIKLLNDNILDDVILKVEADGEPISPKFYNFTTDKLFINFKIDDERLKKYVDKNREQYNEQKLKDGPGFWWFGNEWQTMLNFYLYNESLKKYSEEDYFYNQFEDIDQMEFIKFKIK